MKNIEIVLIFIFVFMGLLYIQNQYAEVEYVLSDIDKRRYLVKATKNKNKAADMLAKLNIKIIKLINHLTQKYPDNIDIKRLKNNYNVDNISEGTETTNYTSYSINKGEQIVFCLRNRDGSDSFVDENVLMYVTIHELGHLMTKEIGHTETFWNNFKFLLEEAIKINIYTKVNYSQDPVNYCGVEIKSSIV